MQAVAFSQQAGVPRAGFSRSTAARIAMIRAERHALDKARADSAPNRRPALEIAPFDAISDPLIEATAARMLAETAAVVGLLLFFLAILAAVAVFGDAPGMSTAIAASGL